MKFNDKEFQVGCHRSKGFSTIELLVVIAVSAILAALAIPGYNSIRRTLRIAGDGRDLNGAINQAKLEAAASFTQARMYADLTTNTFHIETWNKTGGVGGGGCWQTINDPNNPCTVVGTSPVQNLSPGVTYGTAGVGSAPPNTQTQFGLLRCKVRNGNAFGIVSTATCVVFNSRGIPIDPATSAPTGNNAFYITDNNTVYGITIGATGVTQVWTVNADGSGGWQHR